MGMVPSSTTVHRPWSSAALYTRAVAAADLQPDTVRPFICLSNDLPDCEAQDMPFLNSSSSILYYSLLVMFVSQAEDK